MASGLPLRDARHHPRHPVLRRGIAAAGLFTTGLAFLFFGICFSRQQLEVVHFASWKGYLVFTLLGLGN